MNGAAASRCSQLSTTSSRCLARQEALDRLLGGLAREQRRSRASDDRRGHVLGSVHGGERHEVRAVGEVGLDGARGLEREPRLADAAGPGEREQPHGPVAQPFAERARAHARDRSSGSAAPAARSRGPSPVSAARDARSAARRRRARGDAGPARRIACWSSLQLRARLDARAARRGRAGVPVGVQRVGLAAAAIQREHQLRRAAARAADAAATSAASSATSSAWRPSARSASIARLQRRQPQLLQARDLRRRERLDAKSASGGPRHSSSASRSSTPARCGSPAAKRPRGPPRRKRSKRSASSSPGAHPQPIAGRRGDQPRRGRRAPCAGARRRPARS